MNDDEKHEKWTEYEEYHEWGTFWSWAFVVALSGSLITWCMSMMVLVKDVPREWDFGNMEFTPGKSIYSTHDPQETTFENMIQPLPESRPSRNTNADKN